MHAFKFSCTIILLLLSDYYLSILGLACPPIISIKLFNPILGKLASKQQCNRLYMTCCVYSTVWIQLHSQKFGTVPDLIALALVHIYCKLKGTCILIFKVIHFVN